MTTAVDERCSHPRSTLSDGKFGIVAAETLERNKAEQERLYGSTLADLLSQVSQALGISQAKVADVLGISAPMLSQLKSGQRIKIGNPAAVQRLQSLVELADAVQAGRVSVGDAVADLDRTGRMSGVLSRSTTGLTPPEQRGDDGTEHVQALLRAVASAQELLDAAARLEPDFPAIAEVLSLYGAGRTDQARAHYQRVHP